MNINLHIDRLILDGLPIPHSQRPLLQAAVEAELTRLLTVNGLSHHLTNGIAIPQISTSDLQLTPNSSPAQIGQQIAQSVYGGIGQ
ncbi:MAG TPA: hypothetical protein V6D10_01245 [Trichocoleus sp.]|jgi:hypothetical protein